MHNKRKLFFGKTIEFLSVYMFFTFGCLIDLLIYYGADMSIIRDMHLIYLIKITIWILLFGVSFRKSINIKVIIFILGYFIYIYTNYMFSEERKIYVIEMLRYFILYLAPIVFILVCINNPSKFLKYLRLSAYVFLIKTWIVPFTPAYGDAVDYMRYAYMSMVPWAVITLHAFRNKNLYSIFYSVLTIVIYFFYASRGAIFCVLAYILYCLFAYTNIKQKIKIPLLIFPVILFLLSFQKSFVHLMAGFGTYSIKRILNGSYFISESRIEIYEKMLHAIRSEVWGYGLGADRVIGGGRGYYSHNLVIELMITFGCIFGIFLVLFMIYWFIKMLFFCKIPEYRDLFSVFSIPGIVILLLSSSVFIEYYFFASITICILYCDACKAHKFNLRRKTGESVVNNIC